MTVNKTKRPDRDGKHRAQFEKNRRKIYATREVCGICGQPVDKTLHWRDPMAKCIDHIIPVSRGGHPSDIDNLQLAHRTCNRAKSDSLPSDMPRQHARAEKKKEIIGNRVLPQPCDWTKFGKS